VFSVLGLEAARRKKVALTFRSAPSQNEESADPKVGATRLVMREFDAMLRNERVADAPKWPPWATTGCCSKHLCLGYRPLDNIRHFAQPF
jgi:hypothetical protein